MPGTCASTPELRDKIFHTGFEYPDSFGSHVRFSKYKANEPFDLAFQFSTFDNEGQVPLNDKALFKTVIQGSILDIEVEK